MTEEGTPQLGFRRLLVPAPILGEQPLDAACVRGLAVDLAELICRVGGALALPLVGDGAAAFARGSVARSGLRSVLLDHRADGLLALRVESLGDPVRFSARLIGAGGDVLHRQECVWMDPDLRLGRIGLALAAVRALTGEQRRPRLSAGSPSSLLAWRKVLGFRGRGEVGGDPTPLREAIRADPGYVAASLLLAEAQRERGSLRDAARSLELLLDRLPERSWARYRLAEILEADGRLAEAASQRAQVLREGADPRVPFHEGARAEQDGDEQRAFSQYLDAWRAGLAEPELCERLGQRHAARGEHEQALHAWLQALHLQPERGSLHAAMAVVLQRLGRSEQAAERIARALDEAPDAVATWRGQAELFTSLGDLAGAEQALSQALRLARRDDGGAEIEGQLALLDRARIRQELGQTERAEEDLRALLEHRLAPDLLAAAALERSRLRGSSTKIEGGVLLIADAATLLKAGQPGMAIPVLEQGLGMAPESWQGWLMLGLAHGRQRHWEREERALARALRIRPDHGVALSERALALLALGHRKDALRAAERATRLRPDLVSAWCNLALIQLEMGDRDAAKRSFEVGAELAPGDSAVAAGRKELRRRSRRDSWHAEG